MKKILISFLLLAAAATANAHCGSCGTGEKSADKNGAACATSCDDKQEAKCSGAAEKACSKKKAVTCCPAK